MLKFIQYFLIIFLIVVSINYAGKDMNSNEQYTQFIKSFKDDYNTKTYIKDIKPSNKSIRVDSTGLNSINTYHFKAKSQIKGRKGFYLQFRLSVYKYKKPDHSKLAFSNFNKKEQDIKDYMRSKSPMLSILKDKYIYILDGSCLYSRKNMDDIEQKLFRIIYKNINPEKTFTLKRICGGSFTKSN